MKISKFWVWVFWVLRLKCRSPGTQNYSKRVMVHEDLRGQHGCL